MGTQCQALIPSIFHNNGNEEQLVPQPVQSNREKRDQEDLAQHTQLVVLLQFEDYIAIGKERLCENRRNIFFWLPSTVLKKNTLKSSSYKCLFTILHISSNCRAEESSRDNGIAVGQSTNTSLKQTDLYRTNAYVSIHGKTNSQSR